MTSPNAPEVSVSEAFSVVFDSVPDGNEGVSPAFFLTRHCSDRLFNLCIEFSQKQDADARDREVLAEDANFWWWLLQIAESGLEKNSPKP